MHVYFRIKMMDLNTNPSTEELDGSSFGIKKIVDCRVSSEGKQLYKVKWLETWEPAESLITCQNLIDDFWSRVNRAKAVEKTAQQLIQWGKRMNNDNNMWKLSDDCKSNVQELIARTNATPTGNLLSPRSKLMKLNEKNSSNNNTLPPSPRIKTESKSSLPPSSTGGTINNSTLKYLENFDNPYVKVTVSCKVCSKEASKNPAQWKVHYLTHVSESERPFKCEQCGKGFVQKIHLQNHMKKHVKQQQPQQQRQQQQQQQQFTGYNGDMDYGQGVKNEYFQ